MPLVPIKEHRLKGKNYTDLVQDYAELAQDERPDWQRVGNAMLAFIYMVNETFKETYIFGFISYLDIVLNPVDTYKRRDIIVSALYNGNEKTVEYLISRNTYRNRYRCLLEEKNIATSISEAKKYLILAMNKNRIWSYSKELKQLVIDNE